MANGNWGYENLVFTLHFMNPLLKTELPEAARLAALAMRNDPMTAYIYGGAPEEREKRLLPSTGLLIKFAQRYGYNFRLAGYEPDTLVVLLPPGAPKIGFWHIIRLGYLHTIFAYTMETGRRTSEVYRALKPMRQQKKAIGPHWYIHIICVRPEKQGQGLGKQLLQQTLDFINAHNAENRPVLLETTQQRHVWFYEKFGFETVLETDVTAGVRHWLMRRG